MSLVTQARPAAPLVLDTTLKIVRHAESPTEPCILAISGASDFELRTFHIIATGSVDATQSGLLELTLLGLANAPHAAAPSLNAANWTALATNPAEAIGGAGNPPSTQWLMQTVRTMFYLASGKMQGEYTCNVASDPQPVLPLDTPLTGLVRGIDPLCYFAIAARFTPDTPPLTRPQPIVRLARFQLGSEI